MIQEVFSYWLNLHQILWACYGEYGEKKVLPPKESIKPLDALLINGRHKAQELLWTLADSLKSYGKSVAVINPVGHYNDKQTRMLVPDLLVRPVKHAIFFSSTQTQDGGEPSVLTLTLRALRNPNFAYMVDKAHVIMPMFGGSRGHKPGQSRFIGFEVMETIYNSKDLIETVDDIKKSITGPHKYGVYRHVRSYDSSLTFPHVDFATIDIHNKILPAKKFREAHYYFKSLLPSIDQAIKCLHVLSERNLSHLPIRIVACDSGSDGRMEALAKEILLQGREEIELIYIDKTRLRAGEVASSMVNSIVSWKMDEEGNITKKELPRKDENFKKDCVLIYLDDMIDTGGTAGNDKRLVESCFPNSKYSIFVATHPVFSQGVGEALSRIKADTYIVGNSLGTNKFKNYKDVITVDLGPTIAKTIK